MNVLATARTLFAPSLLIALIGCGGADDELPREPVSGEVTIDGKPLAKGRINFQAVGPESTPAGGDVIEGRYTIPREEGPTPGDYMVRITSIPDLPEIDPNAMPGDPPRLPKETIPPRYNVKTTLNAKVEAGGPNTFDFPLTSKAK